MTTILWIFDAVLAAILVWLGWRLLATVDLFKAVVLYIAFGLCMALAWGRLHAFDVALTEAAIGAGLTGALFLSALSHIGNPLSHHPMQSQETGGRHHDDHTC